MKVLRDLASIIKILVLALALIYAASQAQGGEEKQVLEPLKLKSGDEKQNEIKSVKTELLVSKSEDLAAKQIEKLLKKYKGQPIEGELLFRTAELKMRKAKSDRFFEVHKRSNAVLSFAPKKAQTASSKKHISEAVAIYDQIERRFPKFENLDAVVFNNAFARESIGQLGQAEAAYKRLLEKHSYSPLVPEAHLALGEMAFDQHKYDKSLVHFNAIKNYPDSPVYAYGLYKAGWSHYNLRHNEEAIQELEKVIAYGQTIAKKNLDTRFDLRKEALNDLAVFYTESKSSQAAVNYFIQQSAELDPVPYILNLAEIYERHSQYKDVVVVLQDFLAKLADSEQVPDVYNRLVNSFENMRDRKRAIEQLEKFALLCGDGSSWAEKANAKSKDAVPACKETLRETSYKLAQKWLRMWNTSTGHVELANASERAFVVYLVFDDKSPAMADTRFTYAELLFKRKKFKEAAIQYDLAGNYLKESAKRHDARYGAVLAFQQSTNDRFKSSDEAKFFEYSQKYLKEEPNGKFALDVEFKLGLIQYEKGRFAEASPIFTKLGDRFKDTEKGRKAQDLYLDILNSSKDFEAIKLYVKKIVPFEKTPTRVAKLNDIYQQTFFLQIQSLEEKGQTGEALKLYKGFAKTYTNSPLAEKALWNSIQLLLKQKNYNLAAQASLDYAVMFASTGRALEALKLSAQTFETIGRVDKAAEVVERLKAKEPAQAIKWGFLAADFYSLSGQTSKAIKVLNDLLPQLKTVSQKLQYHEKMIIALEKNKPAQAKHYAELARSDSKAHQSAAKNYFFEKTLEQGNPTQIFEESKKILGANVEGWLKAKARLAQAEILHKEFRGQSLNASADRITQVITLKLGKLDKAQTAYQQVVQFGDSESSVKALVGLSTLFAEYVVGLRSMKIPAGIPKEEESAFRDEINKLVLPIEEKGADTIAAAKELIRKTLYHGPLVEDLQKLWVDSQKSNDAYPKYQTTSPQVLFASKVGV